MLCGLAFNVIVSGSMEPELSVNDIVFVQQQDDYYPDDIIVYIDENLKPIAHRLIFIDDFNMATTKGDANNAVDESFNVSNIKGKVMFKIPFLGFFFNDYVKILIFLVVVVLLAVSFVDEYKCRKKDKETLEDLQAQIAQLKNKN